MTPLFYELFNFDLEHGEIVSATVNGVEMIHFIENTCHEDFLKEVAEHMMEGGQYGSDPMDVYKARSED